MPAATRPSPARKRATTAVAKTATAADAATGSSRVHEQFERLYERPGFLMRRAHQIASGVFEDEALASELTPAQFGTLMVISLLPGIDQSTLARALGYDKVTTLRVLRGLEARGLLERNHCGNNRRNISLTLSASGRRLLTDARKAADRAARRVLAPLDAAEQVQLIGLLKKLTSALEPQARAQWVHPLRAVR
jgi:MarR family transcriptional regulator, lower aerobic nicotinate degradation pathway regulator